MLVEACLSQSTHFGWADALIVKSNATSAHALSEAYATLSGDKRLRINPHDAAEMVVSCARILSVQTLDDKEVLGVVETAPRRGISGGSFFDALHAQVARKMGIEVISTLNPSHFRHVAPDLQIETP